MSNLQNWEAESSSEAMEGYDDERDAVGADSAFTSWNTLSTDGADSLLRGRHSYSSSLSSSSSLTSTCTSRRPDGMIIKAKYGTKIIKFGLPLASSLVDLKENVTERLLELKDGIFRIKYQDNEGDWILITDDNDLQFCMASLLSLDQNTIQMFIEAVQHSQREWKHINPRTLVKFAIFCIILYSPLSIFSWICSLFLTLGLPLVALFFMGGWFLVCLLFSESNHFVGHSRHIIHRPNIVFLDEKVVSLKTYSSFCTPRQRWEPKPEHNRMEIGTGSDTMDDLGRTIEAEIIDVTDTTKECVVDTNKDCAMVVETVETKDTDGQPSNEENPGSELVKGQEVTGVAEGLGAGISSPEIVVTNSIKITIPEGCDEGPHLYNSFTALAEEGEAEQDRFGLVEESRTRNLHEMWDPSTRFRHKAHSIRDAGTKGIGKLTRPASFDDLTFFPPSSSLKLFNFAAKLSRRRRFFSRRK